MSKVAEGTAKGVDPDQQSDWVCTICQDLFVQKLRTIMVG